VVFQHLFHEIAVENRPRAGLLGEALLQIFGELFGNNQRTAAGLPRNSHRAPRIPISAPDQPFQPVGTGC
jgi:hypothetical protein